MSSSMDDTKLRVDVWLKQKKYLHMSAGLLFAVHLSVKIYLMYLIHRFLKP